ncbi:uncharacterized protein LOC132754487, partial [Ruditapes philippinarum]|uniref:uncharacterized protein LOC132754487 n=1 Tax=Ruditapes philippinarum TaxID=129788 RepID=UPI00295BA257
MKLQTLTIAGCCLMIFISPLIAEPVHNNDEQDISHIIQRRDAQLAISKRSTSNIVDISMFTDSSAPGKAYSVFVDNTMTRLIIEVKVERSNPVIMLAKPSGIPGPHYKLNGTASAGIVTATIDVAITSADYGIWKLNKLDANTWNVKIQGESSLDFIYQFLSGRFIQVPLIGDPVQGETYKTVLTVADFTKAKSVDVVQIFVFEKYTAANMMFPTDKGNGTYEVANLQMLDRDFMIGINGKDNSGNVFRRIKTINPIALLLSVPAFKDSSVKLYENTKLELVFYVINKLSKDQDIDVRIQDTQGFAETPTIISLTLTPGQNYTGKFVITGGLFGATTNVTITAKPYIRGQKTYGPSVMRQFSVEKNLTTTSTDLPKISDIPTSSFSNTSFVLNSKGGLISANNPSTVPTTSASSIPVTDISKIKSDVLRSSTSKPPEASTITTNDASTARSMFYTSDVPFTKTVTPHIVNISIFTDSSAPGKAYSVYVDSTMKRLIIEVKVERSSPVMFLAKPSEKLFDSLQWIRPILNGTASAGTVTATIDVAITSADYGIWKLNKLDANTWNVKIQGESSLDFTYQFLAGSLIQVPITGDPVQGETYKTVLTVADFTKAKSVDVVHIFVIEKLTPANMLFPTDRGHGKYEIAKLRMLDKDFMVGINGKDNSGHFFRRIKTIKPISLSLSVPSFN